MAQVFTKLDERLIRFIINQPMFFVATAPCLDASGAGGHVNVSPKGYRDTFVVLDPLTVAYLDLTGSGAETIAHLRQNGRITIMFCSFDREPKILRLQGTGRAIVPQDPGWNEFAARFAATGLGTCMKRASHRAIIVVSIDRIADSCGFAVPRMELIEERDLLSQWTGHMSPDSFADYRIEHNSTSIDGLPALG